VPNSRRDGREEPMDEKNETHIDSEIVDRDGLLTGLLRHEIRQRGC